MTRAVQDWNAQTGKVTNLRDPTDMSDAVTVNYLVRVLSDVAYGMYKLLAPPLDAIHVTNKGEWIRFNIVDPYFRDPKYGYLNSNGTSLTNNIKDAVTRFQDTFGLQVTGYENEETLKLMDTPRCGNSDEGIAPFSVNPLVKWNSTQVTWNMIGSGIQYANIVERAFPLYSKHSALEFRRSYSNPTIMVVISPKKHVAYYLKSTCSYDFDGPGGVLGHAFLPRPWLNQSDIHLDFEEDWDFTMNIPAPEKTSFFVVMVHEIGHALGLQHSSVLRSVMFPSYYPPSGINNLYEFDLDRDDQLASQALYGPPVPSSSSTSTTSSTTTSTTTTTTTSTTTRPTTPTPTELDICTVIQDRDRDHGGPINGYGPGAYEDP
ncbi:matrilysin-like [Homalodisca vitripennis]|uniref:matrilysin-like n=1 Tax=Homalodisca vitripennis TaxID=197043 RepID=UPI001EEC344B|nr:matrilysin-like [Homalodisca vitripennis]